MTAISADNLRKTLMERLFGKNVIQNNFRGELAEEIVAMALGREWSHCSGDWSAWDFYRDGVRIQVKQSAARQSWDDPDKEIAKKRVGVFPIAMKSGFYKKNEWQSKSGRHAELYILCWHGDESPAANNFDLSSWEFFVLPVKQIPENSMRSKNTISVPELRSLNVPTCDFNSLKETVEKVARDVNPRWIEE